MTQSLFERIKIDIERLRIAGRVPTYPDVYDPPFDVLPYYANKGLWYTAFEEIESIERDDKVAAYVGYEILKHLALEKDDGGNASKAAARAARILKVLPG